MCTACINKCSWAQSQEQKPTTETPALPLPWGPAPGPPSCILNHFGHQEAFHETKLAAGSHPSWVELRGLFSEASSQAGTTEMLIPSSEQWPVLAQSSLNLFSAKSSGYVFTVCKICDCFVFTMAFSWRPDLAGWKSSWQWLFCFLPLWASSWDRSS